MNPILKLKCVLATVLIFAAIPPALTEDGMGKEPGVRLLARCESARRPPDPSEGDRLSANERADAEACVAFLEGFVWGHAWASWREAKDMWFCLPQGFSGRQGVPVVLDYLQAHPDRLLEDSHLLVFLALTAAYPCKP
jgi:hypothetical protein